MKKKVLSVVLSIVIVFSSCCVGLYVYAENKTVDVNKELLESLLNDRRWVIETLANGDLSNNPYREAAKLPDQTLMEEVLENYQDDADFKLLVDAMELYATTGEKISGFADGVISKFMSWFSCDTSEGALGAVDDLIASTSELKYESILNGVLQSDYTSSWGSTLYEENMHLEYLKQLGSLLKKLPAYQATLKDVVGIHGADSSAIIIYDPNDNVDAEYEIDIETYVNHFLSAYEQDLEAALVNTIAIPGVESNEALEKKILAAGYLGVIYAYERVALPKVEKSLDNIYYEGMFKNTMGIMNSAGKVMKFANKTMDYAIFMETLQSQKNGIVATMDRIEKITSDKDLAKVLNNYGDLVDSEGNNLTVGYEVVANYLRNNQIISNFVAKKVTTGVSKLLEAGVNKYGGANTIVLKNAIAASLAKLAVILDLTVWVVDEVTGIEDTAKKIYVLKYLEKIINEVVNTFNYDLAVYENNKTEENAQAVIDDLEFLKALRLYGEKTAYGSMCAQMDSWLGALLCDGATTEYVEKTYQASIDTYLGCTVSPISQNKLSLSENDTLTIMTDTFKNNPEKTYTYAIWQKNSGETVFFAEPENRLFNGIELNGATLRVLQADNGFYLPVVDNNVDGSVIEIYCNNVAFGNINNSAEMSICQKANGVSYDVVDRIVNSGTLNLTGSDNSANVSVYSLDNKSEINITNTQLTLISNAENTGVVNGSVYVCGGEAFYENSYFTMGRQTLSGTGTYSDLLFANASKNGVKINGRLTVTNSISNLVTRLFSSQNIILTDNCSVLDDYFKGNLSFEDCNITGSFTLDGAAYIYGDVAFNEEIIINDILNITSKCTSLTLHHNTLLKSDLIYNSGIISGEGELSVKGDVDITAISPSISYLNFSGGIAQSFDSENEVVVSKLNNTNTSLRGVYLNQKIYVTDMLYPGANRAYGTGKNVVLTDKAKLYGNYINGSISAENWECIESVDIRGNLYTSGNVSVAENKVVDTINFYNTSDSLTLNKNSVLNCSGEYSNKGTVTNNGIISIKDDSVIAGVFNGGTLKVKGNISASANLSPETLVFESKFSQSFINSASTVVENLEITNASNDGFTVNSVINVNNCFNEKCPNIINKEKIILSSDALWLYDGNSLANITLNSDYTVKSGETLTVNGDLILNSGVNLIIEDGAKVLVKRSVKTSSANINVAYGGSLEITDYLSSNQDTLNIDGELIISGDCKMISSTVNADGLITFKGDLNSSSCTWNNPNISFLSKLKQTVSGSAINVNDLTVNNSSKNGINFSSTVNCYGLYEKGGSVITDESYIVEK